MQTARQSYGRWRHIFVVDTFTCTHYPLGQDMKKKAKIGERVQITARLPRALYREARKRAIDEDCTTANLLERALSAYVTGKRPAAAR